MSRLFSGVLPCGVAITVRNLTGADQGLITKQKNLRDNGNFLKMLAGAIVSLGDKDNVTDKDVERMLAQDRKDALVMLRQHSLRFQETFDFVFDWPADDSTMRKQKQKYSVPFNDEDFERQPCLWVADRLAQLKEAGTPHEGTGYDSFPIMYESYAAMLAENAVQRFILPESQEEIEWTMLGGEIEKKFGTMNKADVDSNTQLLMRLPKLVLGTEGENQNVRTTWSPQRADMLDTEGFRRQIRRVEGLIDTVLTIKNQEDERVTRVDLVGTPDFFFPSQAI